MADLARFLKCCVQIKMRLKIAMYQALLERLRETLQTIQNGIRRSLPQSAMLAAFDQRGKALHFIQIISRAVSAGDFVQPVFEQHGTDSTRGAKAATLMGEKVRKIDYYHQQIPCLTKNH